MRLACIRHTDLPGSSRLFTDFLYRYDRVRDLYSHPPNVDAAVEVGRSLQFDDERRAALVEALRPLNSEGGDAVASSLERLAQPGTVVVATGQQVGLFGGPVFAVYKALAAAKIAETLTARGVDAVPVFWLATEDHDLEEIDHTWAFDAANRPHRLEAQSDGKKGHAAGIARFAGDPSSGLDELFAGLPYADEAVELARRAYRADAAYGDAFASFLRRLLAPYGLIQLDPLAQPIRRLCAPLFAQAIERTGELNAALRERSSRLEERGYHAQVSVAADASLLFRFEDGRRTPLRYEEGRFKTRSAAFTAQELLRDLADSPENFSPNALLRPVTQDYLLPTAVYIGGPAELAYLAQSAVVYERLLGRMPVVMPRATFTLLDQRGHKLLERYGLDTAACFVSRDQLEARIAGALTPPALKREIGTQRAAIEQALDALARPLDGFDPTLGEALGRSRRKIDYQLSKIAGKVERESLRRDSRASEDAEYLSNLLFPEKHLQERRFCVLPFLARHGLGVLDDIYAAVEPECPDHQVLVV